MSRQEDGELHPKAVERLEQRRMDQMNAWKRLVGSALLGCVGLYLLASGTDRMYGLISVGLGFGLATMADLKALKP